MASNIQELLNPVMVFNQKKAAGEPVTQEEVDEVRMLLPVSMAYTEMMRQVRRFNEWKENKEKEG